jgi:predicted amidohydrolase
MTDTLKVGLVQMTSTVSIDRNVELCEPMIREAAEKGAELIVLPEVANLVQKNRAESTKEAVTQDEDAFLAACRSLAEELGVWIHIGSLVVKLPGEERMANRGVMINPAGAVVALYDKIHMFDVDLEGGESYRESKLFKPGEEAVLVDTPWGGYGMAICYDMRFP